MSRTARSTDARQGKRTRAYALAVLLGYALVGLSGKEKPRVAPGSSAPFAERREAAGDPNLRAHAEDVTDYTLHAWLDPSTHTVHGEGSIHFRNTSDRPVHELWFHLYLNAFKNERSAFLREPAAGARGSGPVGEWGTIDLRRLVLRAESDDGGPTDLLPALDIGGGAGDAEDDETEARVPLPHDLEPGESLTLDVSWDDKLPRVVERTGYSGSFHFVGQWFPKLARLESNGVWAHFPFHHLAEFYSDFGTYDVTLDVPENFIVGATGPVVEARNERGRRVERHVQADVHDFAWAAWDRFAVREEDVAGVRVRVLSPRGCEAQAARELDVIRFAIPYFGNRYGAYPYSTLTVVHPPEAAAEAGGMEYPTLITTGGAWYGAPMTRLLEQVTLHEFGHQYFYGLLASNEFLWPFLDEGVNSYAEADSLRVMFGPSSAVAAAGLAVSDDAIQAIVGNASARDAPVAQAAYAFTTGREYASLVYERTASILETLRRVYGDAAVARTLGAYARAFRFGHPGPEDLIRSFAEGVGGEAAAMLRIALFEKGWVDYAVVEVASHKTAPPRGIFDRDGRRETVGEPARSSGSESDGWVLVERRGTLSFPVDIELRLASGARRKVRWDGTASSVRIPYHGATPLVAAVVDPDHTILLDDNLANNHGSSPSAVAPGARRSFERAAYWGELLAELTGP